MLSKVYFATRYGIVGIVGGMTQLFFDYIFIEIFEMWYMYAVVAGFIVALSLTFSLH